MEIKQTCVERRKLMSHLQNKRVCKGTGRQKNGESSITAYIQRTDKGLVRAVRSKDAALQIKSARGGVNAIITSQCSFRHSVLDVIA
ncbi:hypothetical protein QE152_g1272 [Popillia japonica]|uniref:Uncharacterized protein n=1 Tax=Popillia japonica TaxID=7064 RepID=A0AAW1NBF3_POPJA